MLLVARPRIYDLADRIPLLAKKIGRERLQEVWWRMAMMQIAHMLTDYDSYVTLRKAALNLLEYMAVYAPDFDLNAFIMQVVPFMNTAFVVDIIASRNYDLLRLIVPLLVDIHNSDKLIASQKAQWAQAIAVPLAARLTAIQIGEKPIDYVQLIKQIAALTPFPTAVVEALLGANNLDLASEYDHLVDGASPALLALLDRRRKQLGAGGESGHGSSSSGMSPKRRKYGVDFKPRMHTAGTEPGPVCVSCHRPASYICNGCRMIAYCSHKHQREDWSVHGPNCGLVVH